MESPLADVQGDYLIGPLDSPGARARRRSGCAARRIRIVRGRRPANPRSGHRHCQSNPRGDSSADRFPNTHGDRRDGCRRNRAGLDIACRTRRSSASTWLWPRRATWCISAAPRVLADLPGIPAGTAVTNRTIGFGAQPFFPPGIDGSDHGPFFDLYVQDTNNPCTQGSQPANPNQNGIVFFPGALPLYRNGVLVGGLGVSGDGVDQDDYVTSGAALGFEAPANSRADRVFIDGVRMPYLKFPRNPTTVITSRITEPSRAAHDASNSGAASRSDSATRASVCSRIEVEQEQSSRRQHPERRESPRARYCGPIRDARRILHRYTARRKSAHRLPTRNRATLDRAVRRRARDPSHRRCSCRRPQCGIRTLPVDDSAGTIPPKHRRS